MLIPTASTCSPSIKLSTNHNTDEKGLKKFSECLKEAFENYYGYDESILQVGDSFSSGQFWANEDQFWTNEDDSPSTVRGSGSSFNNAIAISDEDGEVSQKSQEFTFKYVTTEDFKETTKKRKR